MQSTTIILVDSGSPNSIVHIYVYLTVKLLKVWTPEKFAVIDHTKIRTKWLYNLSSVPKRCRWNGKQFRPSWSASLLFAYVINRLSHDVAQLKAYIHKKGRGNCHFCLPGFEHAGLWLQICHCTAVHISGLCKEKKKFPHNSWRPGEYGCSYKNSRS